MSISDTNVSTPSSGKLTVVMLRKVLSDPSINDNLLVTIHHDLLIDGIGGTRGAHVVEICKTKDDGRYCESVRFMKRDWVDKIDHSSKLIVFNIW